MATDDLRLKYLKEAARLLAIASPTTSANLGAARRRHLEKQDADIEGPAKEWDAFRREVCGACGNLILPGWSCEVTQESRPRKPVKGTKEDALKSNQREKHMVYSCLRCNRTTIQSLPAETRRPSRKTRLGSTVNRPLSGEAESSQGDQNKVVKTVNASSKQRAKARKGGLQALLAQSKTQSASKGLDLMDFMS